MPSLLRDLVPVMRQRNICTICGLAARHFGLALALIFLPAPLPPPEALETEHCV